MLKTNLASNQHSDKIYFNFYPAFDNHRDIKLVIEMKSVINQNFNEIQRAFVKYFNYFVVPVHNLYLKNSGPIDQVIRFRANACSARTFYAFYQLLSDNTAW
jgi:citrate lyase gamma subunit